MKSLLDLYGVGYQPDDSESVDTRQILGAYDLEQQYRDSIFGKIAARLAESKERLGHTSIFNAAEMGLSGLETMNRWLGSPAYPEQVKTQDALAPLGLAVVSAPFMPRGAVGSAASSLAREAPPAAVHDAPSLPATISGYHGRSARGEHPKDRPFWLTPDADMAGRYATEGLPGATPQVMPVEARFKNPFVFDALGNDYGDILTPRSLLESMPDNLKKVNKFSDTDIVARLARERGHDGLIVKNVVDPPDDIWPSDTPSTSVAALQPGTVYDRLGNLVYSDQNRASLPGLIAGGMEQPQGIRAYHGSPHDFDRFDMSKIGSGEGAQAYGHGLYFAENEDVARSYRTAEAVSPPEQVLAQATLADHGGDVRKAISYLRSSTGDLNAKVAEIRSRAAAARAGGQYASAGSIEARADRLNMVDRAARLLEAGDGSNSAHPGHMYEVNISAHPDDFLDWDKPLAQQSEKVRGALSKLGLHPSLERGYDAYAAMEARAFHRGAPTNGRTGLLESIPQASVDLKDTGIPGIRYLDQQSRGKGDGSSNYVVFDDKIIDILRKYGLAGLIASGAMGQERE